MPIFWDRVWENHKGTESHAFKTADALTLNHQYLKETFPGSYILTEAITREEALGYAVGIPRDGVPAGTEIELMFGEWIRPIAGSGSGSVITVTDDGNTVVIVDNTDPTNPVVTFAGVHVADSIVGTGQTLTPLRLDGDQLSPGALMIYSTDAGGVKGWFPAPSGGGQVNSVQAGLNVEVDATDPANPIVHAGRQAWQWSGVLTTPTLSNVQNNYTQLNLDVSTTLRVIGDLFDPPVFTGIAGGTPGRVIMLHNASPDGAYVYIANNDVLSLNQNRVAMTGVEPYFILEPNELVMLQYDAIDLKWRLIGQYVHHIQDDGSGVVYVNNSDPQRPTVGFNGVFVAAPITGNGTAGSPLTVAATPGNNNFNLTYYVDQAYGNDGTAVPDSQILKYATINAAVTAMGPLDGTIHVSPGAYSITSTIIIGGWKKYYFEPGSSVSCPLYAFSINPGSRLEIKGYADIICQNLIFASSNPASNSIAEVDIECDSLSPSPGNVYMFDPTSLRVKIRTNQIFDMGLNPVGWFDVEIATDLWTSQNTQMIRIDDDSLYDCQTKMDENGARRFVLKGRTRMNADYIRKNTTTGTGGLNILPTTTKTKFTVVDLFANFDTVDGGFIEVAGGITRHYGNVIHRKSDTLGNELPWLFCQNNVPTPENAPYFEHMYGDWVSGTHPVYSGSLNNELASIRCAGTFVFNGRYKNSGENTGVGAWPVFQFQNNNTDPGHTNIIFNGEIANTSSNAPLFEVEDNGVNVWHTYKFIFKTVTCENGGGNIFTSTVPNTPLFVYHSLTMNNNFDPNFIDALSSNRIIIDRDVTVHIPEYQP